MEPDDRPRPEPLRIDVTVTLHRRLGWLLAGVVAGSLQAPALAVRLAALILRAVRDR